MKAILIMCAALSAMAFGEDQKVAKDTPIPPLVQAGQTKERLFTVDEIQRFQLAMKDVALLRQEYKIAEFQTKVAPAEQKQRSIWLAACQALGVPMDKIEAGECQLGQQFMDANGDLLKNPDGSPVVPKVIWKPTPPAPPVTAKK